MNKKDGMNKLSGEYDRILTTDPTVSVTFKDDSIHKMEFDMATRREIYIETGLDIAKAEDQSTILIDPDMTLRVMYMGIKATEPNISMEDVERGIRMRHLAYYIFRLRLAFQVATPDLELLKRVLSDTEGEEDGEGSGPLPSTSDSPSNGPTLDLS